MRMVINFGFSIIEASVLLGVTGCVLPGRYSTYLKYVLFGAAIILGAIAINVINGNIYIKSLVLLTIFTIFCHVLYQGPLQMKIFYLFFAEYICVVSETILINIIVFLPKQDISMLLNGGAVDTGISILIKALVIMAGGLFVYYINRLHPQLPVQYWTVLDMILLLIIEGLQTSAAIELGLLADKSDYLSYMTFLIFMLFLLGIFVIYFLGKICWLYESRMEYELTQLRESELEKIVSYQKHVADEMKKIRHDMNKHLTNILYMLNMDQIGAVKGYIENLVDTVTAAKQEDFSGNYAIDAILNNHISLCKNKGIKFEVSVDDITRVNISPVDVSAILDNLLDNAIEAVDKLSEDRRRITVKMFCYKDNFTVVIKNPYSGKIKIKDGIIDTSKAEWGKHGYGLKSARDAAEKNSGVLRCYIENSLFAAILMLPLL